MLETNPDADTRISNQIVSSLLIKAVNYNVFF